MIKYKFLEERPFFSSNGDKEPRFGHKEIIISLKGIVKTCISPFTIGLFGKWGSGKSTIAENLRVILKKEDIPVIIFDVWKHEGDALRRTFIQELVRQLKDSTTYGNNFFSKDFKLDERLDKTGKSITKGKLEIDFKRFWPLLKKGVKIFCFILFVIVLIGAFIYYEKNILFNSYVQHIISGLTYIVSLISGGALLAWFAQNMSTFITSNDVTYTVDKFKDPHEFEKEFIRVLMALVPKRILIVFDNLDRVSGANSVRIISTIKTFLEPIDKDLKDKDVVFLIPCDEVAIKNHLSKVFVDQTNNNITDNQDYTSEYLRKFFNTILWIPEFYPIELEKFAQEKLKETLIPDFNNDKLSWLITKVFKQNPRQIIQFINILTANYILINEREKGEHIDKDFLKNNTAQLAKYLLLNQKFPLIIDEYKKKRIYSLNNRPFKDEDITDYAQYKVFLEDTSDIYIKSLEPFFTYRISEQEKKIQGVSRLVDLIFEEKRDDALKLSKELYLSEKIIDFSDIVIKQIRLLTNPISAYKFLNILFFITKKLNLTFHENTYFEIQNKFRGIDLENIDKISPNLLESEFFNKFKKYSTDKRKIISKSWINLMSVQPTGALNLKIKTDFSIEVIKQLKKYPKYIYKVDYTKLQAAIANNYSENLTIAKLIITKDELQNIFISTDYVLKFIALIDDKKPTTDIQLDRQKLVLNIIPSLFKPEITDKLVSKITDLIINENNTPITDKNSINNKENLLKFIIMVFRRFKINISKTKHQELNSSFVEVTIQGFEGFRWDNCAIYIPLLYEFKLSKFEPFKSKSTIPITSFVQNATPTSISNSFKFIKNTNGFIEDVDHFSIFKNRALQLQDFFDEFYDIVSDKIKTDWLTGLIENNLIDRFCNKIKDLVYKVPDKNSIGKLIFSKTNESINLDYKDKLYLALDELKVDKLIFNIETMFDRTKAMLTQTDNQIQKLGFDIFKRTKYISEIEKRNLASECLSWLLTSNQPLQYFTARAIAMYYSKLSDQMKKSFINLLFKKFIINSNLPEFIKLGFDLLYDIPTTTLSKQELYFEAIKPKIEQFQNHTLKQEYILGLNKLFSREKNYKKIREYKKWLKRYE